MWNRESNLRFDVADLIERAKRLPKPKVESVSINVPFLTVNVSASNIEKKVAREVLIRLRDKRVLVAWECCNSCIRNALISIQEIRSLLVDKQVELPNEDSPMFLLFDLMLTGIRQFLTFTERKDPFLYRDEYLGALEVLRGHLLRCIDQIAKLSGTKPSLSNRLAFDSEWSPERYIVSPKGRGNCAPTEINRQGYPK
jgi:hypothetical protein